MISAAVGMAANAALKRVVKFTGRVAMSCMLNRQQNSLSLAHLFTILK